MSEKFIVIKPIYWSKVDSVYRYMAETMVCNISHIISIVPENRHLQLELHESVRGKAIYMLHMTGYTHSNAIRCTSSALDDIMAEIDSTERPK